MKRRQYLSIGSVSTGTLRMEDLIPAVLGAVEDLKLSRSERATVRRVARASEDDAYFSDDEREPSPYSDYEALCDIASNHVPDFCSFGSHPGDGADVGVWPDLESLESDSTTDPDDDLSNVLKVNAGEHPTTFACKPGYLMSVTDHGNVSLYRRAGTRWIELWSVV